MYLENHKCIISVPFWSKFIHVYNFWKVAKGPLAQENIVFGERNIHNFRPFFSVNL